MDNCVIVPVIDRLKITMIYHQFRSQWRFVSTHGRVHCCGNPRKNGW